MLITNFSFSQKRKDIWCGIAIENQTSEMNLEIKLPENENYIYLYGEDYKRIVLNLRYVKIKLPVLEGTNLYKFSLKGNKAFSIALAPNDEVSIKFKPHNVVEFSGTNAALHQFRYTDSIIVIPDSCYSTKSYTTFFYSLSKYNDSISLLYNSAIISESANAKSVYQLYIADKQALGYVAAMRELKRIYNFKIDSIKPYKENEWPHYVEYQNAVSYLMFIGKAHNPFYLKTYYGGLWYQEFLKEGYNDNPDKQAIFNNYYLSTAEYSFMDTIYRKNYWADVLTHYFNTTPIWKNYGYASALDSNLVLYKSAEPLSKRTPELEKLLDNFYNTNFPIKAIQNNIKTESLINTLTSSSTTDLLYVGFVDEQSIKKENYFSEIQNLCDSLVQHKLDLLLVSSNALAYDSIQKHSIKTILLTEKQISELLYIQQQTKKILNPENDYFFIYSKQTNKIYLNIPPPANVIRLIKNIKTKKYQ